MTCPTCRKPTAVCVCDRCLPLHPKTRVVILQHPQEQDVVLGTAPLLEVSLGAQRRVGLSWPNLAAAVGDATGRWAVLYPMSLPRPLTPEEAEAPFLLLDRHGVAKSPPVDGLVLLDGTWSQAKALWWRNPWLLKLERALVTPREPSIYGRLRKEPRRTFVSTLEACADALVGNGEPAETRDALRRALRTLVQRARDAEAAAPAP